MGANLEDMSLSELVDLMIEKKVKIMELKQMKDKVAVTVRDDPPIKLSSPKDNLYSLEREYEAIKGVLDKCVRDYQK